MVSTHLRGTQRGTQKGFWEEKEEEIQWVEFPCWGAERREEALLRGTGVHTLVLLKIQYLLPGRA
jgi:hypothetical protein